MNEKEAFRFIQDCIKKYPDFNYSDDSLQDLVKDFKKLSGAYAVVYNELSFSAEKTTTRAIAAPGGVLDKIQSISRINLKKRSYDMDPVVLKTLKNETFTFYESLSEISIHQIPSEITSLLEKLFSTGRVYMLGLFQDEKPLGDLVFIMKKDKDLQNQEFIKILARYLSNLIRQQKKCQNSFLNFVDENVTDKITAQQFNYNIINAIDKIPEIIYQLDENGKIIYINEAIRKYGYDPEELKGKSVLELVDPDSMEEAKWNLMERRTGTRRTNKTEFRLKTPDNKPVYFDSQETELTNLVMDLSSSGLYSGDDQNPEFKGTFGIFRDVTNERRLERDITERNKILEYITENSKDVIWIERLEPQELLYISKSASNLYGEDVLDKDNSRVFMDKVHPDDEDKVTEFLGSLSRCTEKQEIQYRYLSKNNDYRWINSQLFPVNFSKGVNNLILGIASDITEQKKTETELKNEIEREKNINKEANHRIKNNLLMIQSIINMELMSFKETNRPAAEKLTSLNSRISSITKLHELLYKSDTASKPDLKLYLQSICEEILKTSVFEKKSISYEIKFDSDYQTHLRTIVALGMITSELFTNSVKYAFDDSENNKILVSFRNTGGNNFSFELTDNGKPFQTGKEAAVQEGIGMELIEAFAAQLKGSFEYGTAGGEKYFRVNFSSDDIESV